VLPFLLRHQKERSTASNHRPCGGRLAERKIDMKKTLVTQLLMLALAVLVLHPAMASEALMDPANLNATAPDQYDVKFETSKGDFVLSVTRDWAPSGADRFYNLVKNGFFDDVRFFRIVPDFVVQFGLSGDPKISEIWQQAHIKDDPVKETNKAGTITFATSGPDSRTTQVFINLKDNTRLDGMGFSPFGVVTEGMDVVTKLYSGYGDGAPRGRGPNQSRIALEGNAYLDEGFPELDKIVKATISEVKSEAATASKDE
jgi:peptidyl-prolyl cis-trans isomerase A (cyclophilin A)